MSLSKRVAHGCDLSAQLATRVGCGETLLGVDEVEFRCPRCKEPLVGPNVDELADAVMAHLETKHGHTPPRAHVLTRLQRRNTQPRS